MADTPSKKETSLEQKRPSTDQSTATLTDQSSHQPRFRTEPNDVIAGRLIHQFRLRRPYPYRRASQGFSPHLSANEFASRYSTIEHRMWGTTSPASERFIRRLETGQVHITPHRLEIISESLELSPLERALLEEALGYGGLLALVASDLGIRQPNLSSWFQKIDDGQLTLAEVEKVEKTVHEWLDTTMLELKRQFQNQAEPTTELPTATTRTGDS